MKAAAEMGTRNKSRRRAALLLSLWSANKLTRPPPLLLLVLLERRERAIIPLHIRPHVKQEVDGPDLAKAAKSFRNRWPGPKRKRRWRDWVTRSIGPRRRPPDLFSWAPLISSPLEFAEPSHFLTHGARCANLQGPIRLVVVGDTIDRLPVHMRRLTFSSASSPPRLLPVDKQQRTREWYALF